LKKIFLKGFAIVLILIILVSPYLLIIDFARYSPIILTVWLMSAAYYVFVKSRQDREKEEGKEK
jgi:hypothetical protein